MYNYYQVINFVPQQEAWVIERFGRFSRVLEPVSNSYSCIINKINPIESKFFGPFVIRKDVKKGYKNRYILKWMNNYCSYLLIFIISTLNIFICFEWYFCNIACFLHPCAVNGPSLPLSWQLSTQDSFVKLLFTTFPNTGTRYSNSVHWTNQIRPKSERSCDRSPISVRYHPRWDTIGF